jgi:hypothetical protein
MVTTMSRSRIHMQPMRRLKHTSKRVHFFLLGGGGGGGGGGGVRMEIFKFLCSHHISNLFSHVPNDVPQVSMDVPQVCNVFPKGIPNSTPLNLISLPNSYPFLTYIMSQMGGTPSSYRNCYCRGASQVSVFIGLWTNQNGLLQKNKNKT